MIYRTIYLNDIIKNFGKETAKEVLSDFSCPLNKDVEVFAHKKAIDFEIAGISRTYLVVAQEGEEIHGICALYSIAPKSLYIEGNFSAARKRKLFGTTFTVGNPINAILIGQLSKNFKNGRDKYITGEILMSLIVDCIKKVDILIPSVSVYVECEDNEKIRRYYERFGFELLGKNEDKDLLRYLIPTRTFTNPEYKKKYYKK